jgi:signal transduction histidine kinase
LRYITVIHPRKIDINRHLTCSFAMKSLCGLGIDLLCGSQYAVPKVTSVVRQAQSPLRKLIGLPLHLGMYLTKPAHALVDSNQRWQARVLASVLLVTTIIGATGSAVLPVLFPEPGEEWDMQAYTTALIGAVCMVVCYMVSRTKYFKWSAAMTIALMVGTVISIMVHAPGDYDLVHYLVLASLLSTVVYPPHVTAGIVTVITALLIGLSPMISIDPFMIMYSILFFAFSSIMIVFTQYFHARLEKQRNTALANESQRAEMALIQARDSALQTAKIKTDFMSNLSHEVRTPMTGVIGMLELLMETSLDAKQSSFVKTAHASAQDMLELLNQILDFSKLEAGRMTIESRPVDLRGLLYRLQFTLSAPASKKDLTLDLEVADNVPDYVLGDETRIRQVVANLVSNAVKFTLQGGVVMRVKVLHCPSEHVNGHVNGHTHGHLNGNGLNGNGLNGNGQSKTRLRFEVTDTGIGIPAAMQGKVFESFVQGDGSTTRRFGGTGLGLSICKQLVELMGGTIDVQSVEGVGSTFGFTLTLPVVDYAENTKDERMLMRV